MSSHFCIALELHVVQQFGSTCIKKAESLSFTMFCDCSEPFDVFSTLSMMVVGIMGKPNHLV